MPTSFPGAVDLASLFAPDVTDDTDAVTGTPRTGSVGFHAQWMRDVGGALIAIENEQGPNASGTFATIADRLASRVDVRKTADQATTSQTNANVTDLVFPVLANIDYSFFFYVMYRCAATAQGIRLAVTTPASVTRIAYGVSIFGVAADGTAAVFHGAGSSSDDSVISAAVAAATTSYIATIHGVLANGANAGNIQLRFARGSGTTTTAPGTTLEKGSYGNMYVN